MLLERTWTADDIRKYREQTGASMMEAKRHFEDQHRANQRALLHTVIEHAEINKDFSLVISALKILAEKY